MYIPSYYREDDREKLLAFMREFNFATVISSAAGAPVATHLPFIVETRGDEIVLISHMAKANPHWKHFSDEDLLVIFQGPHAYISPSHYEKKQNVPTWNYIAVHAYGRPRVIGDEAALYALMERSIEEFEKGFFQQWKELSRDYVDSMLKAIVGFEVVVKKLEGKFKLSQNKTRTEQQNIITDLSESGDQLKETLAEKMRGNQKS